MEPFSLDKDNIIKAEIINNNDNSNENDNNDDKMPLLQKDYNKILQNIVAS